jgi:hypothetical protein
MLSSPLSGRYEHCELHNGASRHMATRRITHLPNFGNGGDNFDNKACSKKFAIFPFALFGVCTPQLIASRQAVPPEISIALFPALSAGNNL